jgi:hypothetical protein
MDPARTEPADTGDPFLMEVSRQVWRAKYQHRDDDTLHDRTICQEAPPLTFVKTVGFPWGILRPERADELTAGAST